ncbi:MAG: hypothetical protein V1725_01350 [archaeon]
MNGQHSDRRIVMIDGMKGTGKSTIVELLRQEGYPIIAKYTKQTYTTNHFFEVLGALCGIAQPNDTLALPFYSTLFERLISNEGIMEKGLLSIYSAGYYGYLLHDRPVPFDDYQHMLDFVFESALNVYSPKVEVISLRCSDAEREARLGRRTPLHGDIVFREHVEQYKQFFSRAEELLKGHGIPVITFQNDNRQDLARIVHAPRSLCPYLPKKLKEKQGVQ